MRISRTCPSLVILSLLVANACGDDDEPSEAPDASVLDADAGIPEGGRDAGTDRDSGPGEDPLLAPLRRLEAESRDPFLVGVERGFPSGIVGRFATSGSAPVDRARSFLDAHGDVFSQGDTLSLGVLRSASFTAPGGGRAERVVFHQSYLGVPVSGAEIAVMLDGTDVVATMGRLLTSDTTLDTTPALGPADAIRLANEAQPPVSGIVVGRPKLVVYDRGLVAPRVPSEPHLAWRVTIDALTHWVDAHTGEMLRTADDGLDAFSIEVRETYYGEDELGVDAYVAFPVWIDGQCKSRIFGPEPRVYCTETTRLVDMFRDAYDLYAALGWRSYDGNDGQIDVYSPSIYGDEDVGAEYRQVNFDEEFHFRTGHVAADIVGHEYTHGVIDHGSDLDSSDETGALHESLADLMGNLVEGDLPPGEVGEDLMMGPLRSMCAPTEHGDPDHYSGYLDISIDDGGVHSNNGIPNRAWCAIAERLTTAGLGRGEVDALLAELGLAAIQSLPSSASFHAARAVTMWAAFQHGSIGGSADPYAFPCAVALAWDSVGISGGIDPLGTLCATTERDQDSDYRIDDDDNCPEVANPSQLDADHDGQGDACDDDRDDDGVVNAYDNCPDQPNADQADNQDEDPAHVFDEIYFGDACDPDQDDDDAIDVEDNCPGVANEDQDDDDDDGIGDACEPDDDGDGVRSDGDDCPFVANAPSGGAQADMDGDGLGDACDECPLAADETSAYTTGIPALGIDPSPLAPDSDDDGTPDACDDTPYGGNLTLDGGRAIEAALGPGVTNVRVSATPTLAPAGLPESERAWTWLPIDPCRGLCTGDWAEDTFVIIRLVDRTVPDPDGDPAADGLQVSVLDDRGDVVASTGRYGASLLQFRARGGRGYALWMGSAGRIELDVSIDLGDALEPDPDDACSGRPNGRTCALSAMEAGVCIEGACVVARCGDFFTTSPEECDDGNDVLGDGCEPLTCQHSCELDAECDDGQSCDGVETCSTGLHLCLAGRPEADGTGCTAAAGESGTCRGGSCAAGGCGDGVPGGSEQCDDGDPIDGNGCDNDCTYSCTTDADCTDGDPCNGLETCDVAMHRCAGSRVADCDDGNACTMDGCASSACTHVLVDADMDGYAPTSLGACGTDCSDVTFGINPGVAEECNGIDDDCDGMIDEDIGRVCHRDQDGDRFGDASMSMMVCGTCPSGWVPLRLTAAPFDCADWQSNAYPDAAAHETPYCAVAPGATCPSSTFDYDCDGVEEPQQTRVSLGCAVSGVGCTGGGWQGAVPGCGEPGMYVTCSRFGTSCIGLPVTQTQACR